MDDQNPSTLTSKILKRQMAIFTNEKWLDEYAIYHPNQDE
jgi:hypothetical protein